MPACGQHTSGLKTQCVKKTYILSTHEVAAKAIAIDYTSLAAFWPSTISN